MKRLRAFKWSAWTWGHAGKLKRGVTGTKSINNEWYRLCGNGKCSAKTSIPPALKNPFMNVGCGPLIAA